MECNHGWFSVGTLHAPAAGRLHVRAAGWPAGQDCTG